jgi:hypothetical protein
MLYKGMYSLNYILLCLSLPTVMTASITGIKKVTLNTYPLALFDTREERESCRALESVPNQTRARLQPLRCLRHLTLQSTIKFARQLSLGWVHLGQRPLFLDQIVWMTLHPKR